MTLVRPVAPIYRAHMCCGPIFKYLEILFHSLTSPYEEVMLSLSDRKDRNANFFYENARLG